MALLNPSSRVGKVYTFVIKKNYGKAAEEAKNLTEASNQAYHLSEAYRLLNDVSTENADVEAIKKELDRIGVIPRENGTKSKARVNNSRCRRSLCSSPAGTATSTLNAFGVSSAMMASTLGTRQEAGEGGSSFFKPFFSTGSYP
jgi:hypothetical protein